MSITVSEKIKSRHLTQTIKEGYIENRLTRVLLFKGTSNAGQAAVVLTSPLIGEGWTELVSGVPTNTLGIYCHDRKYQVLHDGNGNEAQAIIELTAIYGPPIRMPDPASSSNSGGATAIEELDIATDTMHIKRAISQTHFPSTAVEPGEAINSPENGQVDGVDIILPKVNRTFRIQIDSLPQSTQVDIANLVGRTNTSAFKRCDAHTMLFLGLKATRRDNGPWDCVFSFAYSPNETLTITTIDGDQTVTKNGCDYLWERIGSVGVSGLDVTQIVSVHVAKVYQDDDFSFLPI